MTQSVGSLVLAVVAVALLRAGSHVRIPGDTSAAAVRVSWSARPERVEVCRRISDEELEQLAQHMRRRVVCEGTTARYRLEVTHNGRLIDSATVRGGGLRHDREVYVARELTIAPGVARLSVRFARLDSSSVIEGTERQEPGDRATRETSATRESRESREDDERRRRRAEAIPALLAIDTTVTVQHRAVVLVTYDAIGRRLVLRDVP